MDKYGIVIVSHSKNLAQGVYDLIQEVAKEVDVTFVGGVEEGRIGTSFDGVNNAIESNPCQKLLAFFDLGSARMNLDIVVDMTDKEIEIFRVPIVEGAYTAAALLQAGAQIDAVKAQLKELEIIK